MEIKKYFVSVLIMKCINIILLFLQQQQSKHDNSTGPSTPEDEDEDAPPPIATRPDKTKSIVCSSGFSIIRLK